MDGALTLLFTDLVDSTRLNDEHGDAALAALWQAHDRAARGLMRTWRGRELARSDGFLVIFAGAADAVGFAQAYHAMLIGLDIAVCARVGMHTGNVALRENAPDDVARGAPACEIDGIALPTAARIMSLARGGQTLLSGDTRRALGDAAAHWPLADLGHWQLKGVTEPVRLFEVGDPHAPPEPPPDSEKAHCVVRSGERWLPRRRIPHNLPAERDAFVGRGAEMQVLAADFDRGARLVSLFGMGGIGKTRLALHFAWSWLGSFPGGAWFCDISQARSAEGLRHAVASALDVPLGDADPDAQLARAIAGRGRCLIVLDNVEQVARLAAVTLGAWLDRSTQAAFLVTTREVLGIAGERVVELPPLPAADAAELFVRRAQAASNAFELRPGERADVGRLVRLLDGLPLAVELAAVRARVMTPAMILDRMNERFRLLGGADSGRRPDRQATLRSTLDWSWELLSTAEKAALVQLSVFQGGFTFDALEAVLHLPDDVRWPADVVQGLVEKSMVHRSSRARFELLQSIRDYAVERGDDDESRALVAAARERHWRHYANVDEAAAIADACADTDNLCAACRHALAAGDAGTAVRALAGAWSALRASGGFRAAAELGGGFDAVRSTLPPAQAAVVDWVAGSAAYLLGSVAAAQARYNAGLAAARAGGASQLEVRILCALGELLITAGHLTAADDALQRAGALADTLGDRTLAYRVANGLGSLAIEQGRAEDALRQFEHALRLAREVGDRRWEAALLSNIGTLYHDAGRYDEAERHYTSALALATAVGERPWEGSARCNLALLHHEQGRHAQARQGLEAALELSRLLGHPHLECTAACNLGIVLEALGEGTAARGHYEAAVDTAHALGDGHAEGQFRGYLGRLYARQGEFARARDCHAIGETLLAADPGRRVSLGVLLCARAEVEALAGEPSAAQAILARALAISDGANAAPGSELGLAIAQARAAVAPPVR